MPAFFIYNNLKVSMHLKDAPVPGFEVLRYEKQCSTIGTLWDIGYDAGFTLIGKTEVKGQLWVTDNLSAIDELETYYGVSKGITQPLKIDVKVLIEEKPDIFENIAATTYSLTNIKKEYNIIYDGWWSLKRWKPSNDGGLC